MPSNEAIAKSLNIIKKEVDETLNFIHVDSSTKPMPLINIAIDKLYELKELEFNIKQLSQGAER